MQNVYSHLCVSLQVRNFEDVPDLHSTAIEQSKEELEDCCEGVSRVVLVDALVVASGEMEVKNRLVGDSESERRFPTVNDQVRCHPFVFFTEFPHCSVQQRTFVDYITACKRKHFQTFLKSWILLKKH